VSREPLGSVLPASGEEHHARAGSVVVNAVTTSADPTVSGSVNADGEAEEFVRFCYRRRAVAWPELYDEMCAVAARGDFRGMDYEQLQGLGIGFALSALPRLAELAARVIAQERGPQSIAAVA
jgi:hypothetical protein